MSYEIDIALQCPAWEKSISDIEALTHDTITAVLKQVLPKQTNIEISIVLSDDDFIQNLNNTYRNKDKPTNVLSFPMTAKAELKKKQFLSLGDIIIAHETILAEAKEQHKDVTAHFRHMLVHGCLHLLHYDHETEKEASTMEKLEISLLHNMGIKNPYETE
jgi:probable rRNA maturation factor